MRYAVVALLAGLVMVAWTVHAKPNHILLEGIENDTAYDVTAWVCTMASDDTLYGRGCLVLRTKAGTTAGGPTMLECDERMRYVGAAAIIPDHPPNTEVPAKCGGRIAVQIVDHPPRIIIG